jgi:hypothetical protein
MSSRGSGVVAALALAGAAMSAAAHEPPVIGRSEPLAIPYTTVAGARAAVTAVPQVEVNESDGWLVVVLQWSREQWRFTPPGHAAHPAAIRRRMTGRRATAAVQMGILCEGAAPACAALADEYERENAEIVAHEREHAHDDH